MKSWEPPQRVPAKQFIGTILEAKMRFQIGIEKWIPILNDNLGPSTFGKSGEREGRSSRGGLGCAKVEERG